MVDICIRPYNDKEDRHTLGVMLQTIFSPHASHADKLVGWKYQHPFFHSGTITWVATDGPTIVGHYCNVPMETVKNGKPVKSMMCLDMATASTHRRRGIIGRLSHNVYERVEEQGYEYSFGFSTTAGVLVDTHAKNYGYIVVDTVRLLRKIPVFQIFPPAHVTIRQIFTFPHTIHVCAQPGIGIHTTAAYLTWRYIDKPGDRSYRFFEVSRDGEVVGYVVTSQGVGILRILDWIPVQKISEELVIRFFEHIAYLRRCIGISMMFYGTSLLEKVCLKYGYVTKKVRHPYYLTVRKNVSSCPNDVIDANQWHGMGGDIV
jgi:hypothetical protein